MKTTGLNYPKVVTRAEWLAARKKLLAREKEITRLRDALNADRRRLPMVRVEKDYRFEGPRGKAEPLDLFEGRLQLIVYHTHSTYGRGAEAVGGASYFLDLTALGRQRKDRLSR